MVLASAVSNPLLPHGPQDARLLCLWDFPGDITGVDRYVLQGIFPTQGSNSRRLGLPHWQVGSSPLAPPGKP